jgi:hypothetical protein
MHHRVGDGFPHSHVDAEGDLLIKPAIPDKVRRGGSSVSNRLNVAGQNESSRLFGHKRARPFSPGIAVWLLLSSSKRKTDV